MITTKTIMNIEEMSDSGILVTAALEMMKVYGQLPEEWKRVAEIYGTYKREVADQMIEGELGDEYCLDVEMCTMYLLNAGLAR